MNKPNKLLQQGHEYFGLVSMIAPVVAEEVNELLTASLDGWESMTRSKTECGHQEITTELLETIREAQSMMFTFSILAHQVRPNKDVTDVNLLLRDTLDKRSEDFDRQDVQLISQFDLGISRISADRDMLGKAFDEIVLNALDSMNFVEHRKQLVVSTAYKREVIEVVFEDNGPGIAPAVKRCMFKPFFTTKGADHKGLGLCVCKSVMSKHQGRVRARDNRGQGAKIVLSLPVLNS